MAEKARFTCTLAQDSDDLRAAQRLRYAVFVAERGGDGPGVDHAQRLETQPCDPFADHLLLRDEKRSGDDAVVAVYRLMSRGQAARAGAFSSAHEFRLDEFAGAAKEPLELSRACIRREYRGGITLGLMWQALGDLIAARGVDRIFGVASFYGPDPLAHAPAIAHLSERFAAPEHWGLVCREPLALPRTAPLDAKSALKGVPPLILSYLRLGGRVGRGAYRDAAFGTVDLCMALEVAAIPAAARRRLQGALLRGREGKA